MASEEDASCPPTCRPASMSRRSKPAPVPSRASAPLSPPSSAWPPQAPSTQPTLVTNWTQFTQTFGDFVEGSYLAHAVYGYFQNGGGNCYIVRIGGQRRRHRPPGPSSTSGTGGDEARRPTASPPSRPEPRATTSPSRSPTAAGEGAAEDTFKLIVKKGSKVEETFDNVTTKRGKQNVVTVVNAQSQAHPARGDSATGRASRRSARARSTWAAAGGRAHRRWRPTTTSATPPTAPASAASRPSTRSPWSACPT